jgi:hypothetical protein
MHGYNLTFSQWSFALLASDTFLNFDLRRPHSAFNKGELLSKAILIMNKQYYRTIAATLHACLLGRYGPLGQQRTVW